MAFLLADEILLMIFSYLPLQDIKCLRLVCHCFLSSSSQFLFWPLKISSASSSLRFFRKISSSKLFRKGISNLVYNTRLNSISSSGESDKILPNAQHAETQELMLDGFDQCYSVYDLLCYGIPRLPMLREITITDRMLEPSPNPITADISVVETDIDEKIIRNAELSLFILLRALWVVRCRPQTFRISLQSCIAGTMSAIQPQSNTTNETNYGTGYGTTYSPTLFDRCLTSALPIFQDLRHLSIITQCLDLQTGTESSSTFIYNLCAFISTAGLGLEVLQVTIQELLSPAVRFETPLFSTELFSITPVLFPDLREIVLKGVPMEGFDLVSFLSRQPALEELKLQEVRLTSRSPDWAGIVDDLCLLLGVQFEAGDRRRRSKCVAPMEKIRSELESVFEPEDGVLENGISVGPGDLRGYFEGREDNPLRSCYENFVVGGVGWT